MTREIRHLKFVLKYYTPGVFDTKKALRTYKSQHPVAIKYWNRYIAGIAASIAITLGIGYYLFRQAPQTTHLYAYNHAVTYILPDSSTVTLYPNSSLTYNSAEFGEKERHVTMTGKVRFEVEKNPRSPFIATASAATVKVLGTQFIIDDTNPDSIGVSVSSGKVLFTAGDSKEGVTLTKGMQACLLANDMKPHLIKSDESVAAVRKFVFDNTPLSDVLKELSAYFHVELSCASPDKSLTAEFETDNLDEIIMIIEKSLDVKIQKKLSDE